MRCLLRCSCKFCQFHFGCGFVARKRLEFVGDVYLLRGIGLVGLICIFLVFCVGVLTWCWPLARMAMLAIAWGLGKICLVAIFCTLLKDLLV